MATFPVAFCASVQKIQLIHVPARTRQQVARTVIRYRAKGPRPRRERRLNIYLKRQC